MKVSKKILTPFGIVLLLLSLVYIGAEGIFNMRLLDVAGTVRSDPEALKNLQYFGRSVSAYGFTLLVLGVFEVHGFKLATRRQWALALALAFVCMGPFCAMFWQNVGAALLDDPHPYNTHLETFEMTLCFVPLLGLACLCASAGFRRSLVVLGLVLMAWPAMFLGQKLLIERYLIDTTTWQERQDARSMLMLRSGLEDGMLELGDMQLHDGGAGVADMKAARIVMSALWMIHPDSVLEDLKDNRDAMVEYAAANGTWFSSAEAYGKYVRKVKSERNKYQMQMMDKYYAPYARASDMYARVMTPSYLDSQAEQAAKEIDLGIDDGWAQYQAAVREMRQSMSIVLGNAMRHAAPLSNYANNYCATHACPDVDLTRPVEEAQAAAETSFYVKSGYHSDIPDRATFVAQKQTQDKIRKQVQDKIRTGFGLPDFALPKDWRYDPGSFKKTIKSLLRKQAQDAWHAKFGDKLPPGLSPDEFAAALGVKVPSVDNLLMSPDDFFRKYVLPGNQKMVDNMLAELRAARAKYPPDTTQTEEGKEYADALYIPTISLVVSLSVVMMTLLRGLLAGVGVLYKALHHRYRLKQWMCYAAQGAVTLGFIGFLLALPHIVPNPYASGQTYRRYLSDAEARSPAIAHVLNWAVQVQPVIYRFGMDIQRAAGAGGG
jgi:hypothetical protein